MEETLDTFRDPVPLQKGVNLKDAMTSASEFHIDLDFKKAKQMFINGDEDLFPDMEDDEDSDEDVLKTMEENTQNLMLASPEYHSFTELSQKMVDCVPSGDAKILILEEGDGPLVPVDAEVTVHYAAYWEKASIPFDSTLTMNFGKPKTLYLGNGNLLPGLEIGLTTVRGPKARFMLLLQPALTWGPLGVPPRLKPEPALFIIALYDVRDTQAAARFNDLPIEQQSKFEVTIRTVTSLHTQAKGYFSKKKYRKAIKNYQQSISVINVSKTDEESEVNQLKQLKINALLNSAVCFSKLNYPKHVIRMLENLDYYTDVDKHCKAQFYYGKAYEALGKTEEAIKYYQQALKIEPKNKDIGKALDHLDNYIKTSAKAEKDMWKTAFKTQIKEKIDVDEDFKNGVKDMFADLAGSNAYAKFELPPGLSKAEVDFVKDLAKEYENFAVVENGEGKKKRVTIVKKLL